MFNARLYGAAQGSLIAKSIHQEDLQCNESSVRGRRKASPPKIASAAPKTFSPGRGGRGAWRGGRGFMRGRGGGAGHFASSRLFQKSRPQAPNLSSSNSSSTPVTMSNGAIPPVVSGITRHPSSSMSHPRSPHHSPSQPQPWKGKAVIPATKDKNPRPAKRRRIDDSFPAFVQSHVLGSRFPPGGHEEPSTCPTSAEDTASTRNSNASAPPAIPFNGPRHKLQQSLPRPSISNAKELANQVDGTLGSPQQIFQQFSDRLPPHIASNTIFPTVNNGLSAIPPWRATNRKWDLFQNGQPMPAGMLTDPPPTLIFSTKLPSSRTSVASPASPSAVEATPSYQLFRASTTIAEGLKCPHSSSSNKLLDDTKGPAEYTSTTDTSSPHALNATSRSLSRPAHAPKAIISTYEGHRRPQPESTESSSTMPPSSDVQRIPSALTIHVKKEPPPSLPLLKRSPTSSAAQVKSENVGTSLIEYHRVSAEDKDPIVIKQEPDLLESIIPQRKLVTKLCSFYPIPQNCRKSVPNYKNNRIEYFRKEYKRLREFGLTKQKVVFRDDGLAIEWTSPIPVWSDTLLPEAST